MASQSPPASTPSAAQWGSHSPLKELDPGANAVRHALTADQSWPDLVSSLTNSYSGYKFSFTNPPAPLVRVRSVPLPDMVLDAYASSPPGTPPPRQGLFPSLDRAWAALGKTLYLWSYASVGSPAVETFEHSGHITDAAIVPPRPGVFNQAVFQVLLLASQHSVTLVCFAKNDNDELALYVPDHKADTGKVQLFDFHGTSTGRIFARGSDACLYELIYQARPGWIYGKCWLKNLTASWPDIWPRLPRITLKSNDPRPDSLDAIAVDDARKALYVLRSQRDIYVYHLPSGNDWPVHVGHISDLYRLGSLQAHAAGMVPPHEFKVVSLLVVPPQESTVVHLVAVTSRGDRYYFTHAKHVSRTGYLTHAASSGPSTLELIYSRQAPVKGQPPILNDQPQSDYPATHPGLVDTSHALLSDGLFLATAPAPCAPSGGGPTSHAAAGANDIVFAAARTTQQPKTETFGGALGPREELADNATDVLVPGTTWALAQTPSSSKAVAGAVRDNGLYVHPLALQLLRPARTFLHLSSYGLTVLAEQRPIDVLRSLLSTNMIYDQELISFYQTYGAIQSCAMAIAIAAHHSTLNSAQGSEAYVSQDLTQVAVKILFEWGGMPKLDKPAYPPLAAAAATNAANTNQTVTFSHRHDGLALYVARLIRPFWLAKVFLPPPPAPKVASPNDQPRVWTLAVDRTTLERAQADLQQLVVFLQRHASILTMTAQSTEEDMRAQSLEKASWASIQSVLERTSEAVNFVLLLADPMANAGVGGVAGVLGAVPEPVAQRIRLGSLSWRDLVLSPGGQPAARALVEALVDRSLAAGLGVDQVAHALQTRCPTLCSPSDVRLYRALDGLKRAKTQGVEGASATLVTEAYELLARSAGTLGQDKLASVTTDFAALLFAPGAILLPLAAAQASDPKDLASTYFDKVVVPRLSRGLPGIDPTADRDHEGYAAYQTRDQIYTLVLSSLQAFDDAVNTLLNAPVPQQGKLDLANTARDSAYHLIWTCTDGLLQERVYAWLLAQGREEQLLSLPAPTPRLVAWLGRSACDMVRLELLWQLHVRQNHPTAAAQVLLALAETQELDLVLTARIQYLSLASSIARSASAGAIADVAWTGQLDHIQERLDVAKLQARLVDAVREANLDSEVETQALATLDNELLTVSQMYRGFAEPLALWGMLLLIMHVAEYHDEVRERTAWTQLLQQADDEALASGKLAWEHVGSKVGDVISAMTEPDTPLSLEPVLPLLERYAWESEAVPAGWAAQVLVSNGADPQAVLEVLSGLALNRTEPWDQVAARKMLLRGIAAFLAEWVDDEAGDGSGRFSVRHRAVPNLPAAQVDHIIDDLLVSGAAAVAPEAERQLREVQARVRAWF